MSLNEFLYSPGCIIAYEIHKKIPSESNYWHGDFQSITPSFLTSSNYLSCWNNSILISTPLPTFADFSRFWTDFHTQIHTQARQSPSHGVFWEEFIGNFWTSRLWFLWTHSANPGQVWFQTVPCKISHGEKFMNYGAEKHPPNALLTCFLFSN